MTRPLALILALLLAAVPAAGQTFPSSQPTTAPAAAVVYPRGVVVACYHQPLENLAQWKARGVNAAVGPELGNPARVTSKQWCDEAERLGLAVIGTEQLLKDGYRPRNLIAWICRDEPNSANHNTPPASVALEAAAFRAVDPTLPVICTLAGDKLTSAGARDNPLYEAYVAAVDVVWADWYPLNRQADRYPLSFKTKELEYLKARGARVVGSVLETSWQKLNKADPRGRAPTPDELEQEVNLALAAGATWVVYFSTAEYGYPWPLAYDPTTPDVVARISSINARLNPPPATLPTTQPTDPALAALQSALDATRADLVALKATVGNLNADNAALKAQQAKTNAALDGMRQALGPAPTTQPNP